MAYGPQGYIALNARGAMLKWQKLNDDSLLGFEIWISNHKGGPYSRISGKNPIKENYYITPELRFGTYYFVITSLDYNYNRSPKSNEVQLTIS